MRPPREIPLAGLGLCSYDLGLEIFRGKVLETELWSEGDSGQQSQSVALGFRLRRASIVNCVASLDRTGTIFVVDDVHLLVPKPVRPGK